MTTTEDLLSQASKRLSTEPALTPSIADKDANLIISLLQMKITLALLATKLLILCSMSLMTRLKRVGILLYFIEKNNSRNNQISQGNVNKWADNSNNGITMSSHIVLSCFATHDGIIKSKIEAGFSNEKLTNSGRKSHNVSVKANESNFNNYLKLNYKTINNSINSSNSNRIWMRTGRGLSFKWDDQKNNQGLFGNMKKLKIKIKDKMNTNHSISIESQWVKQPSLYEWSTQHVSAIKIPSYLISEKKNFQSILRDTKIIEANKKLFPQTSK